MQKIGKVIKVITIILLVCLLMLVIAGVVGWRLLDNKLSKVNYEGIPEEQIEVNEGVELEKKGYRRIADTYVNTIFDKF